uniref:AlNc14C182G8244 protein n=1 Tax=Albugo laibachii Nc14 TaxID=890382 RepID=F0WP96_9STRA|nr:AlNc14C182G8244 [Albugo laibachii Nc14]|eukprot:CCA23142.1 AlNc14C182G8244 [Albugo laibachii Nc14]
MGLASVIRTNEEKAVSIVDFSMKMPVLMAACKIWYRRLDVQQSGSFSWILFELLKVSVFLAFVVGVIGLWYDSSQDTLVRKPRMKLLLCFRVSRWTYF